MVAPFGRVVDDVRYRMETALLGECREYILLDRFSSTAAGNQVGPWWFSINVDRGLGTGRHQGPTCLPAGTQLFHAHGNHCNGAALRNVADRDRGAEADGGAEAEGR